MDMEIQQVPWWNRRSRLERRFFVMSIALLCATVGLAIGSSVTAGNTRHNRQSR